MSNLFEYIQLKCQKVNTLKSSYSNICLYYAFKNLFVSLLTVFICHFRDMKYDFDILYIYNFYNWPLMFFLIFFVSAMCKVETNYETK